MDYQVKQIAKALDAEVFGDGDIIISGVAEPSQAKSTDIALAMDAKYAADLPKGQAQVAMLWPGADWQAMGLRAAIVAPRPRFTLSGLSAMMDPGQSVPSGIHPTAVIENSATLGQDVSIGPFTYIGKDAIIGDHAQIGAQCYIGSGVTLGRDARLREAVKVGARVTIGDRFVAQPGVVVGGDGFSFVTPEVSAVEHVRDSLGEERGDITAQSWSRIHSLGSVTIGDDVELGANSCVDSGTVRDTVIGNGVKCDNLSQIGHNVQIGNDCLICAQVGIAGSARIGNHVVLGGQTGISDNVFVGDHVITGGATKVLSNVPTGRVMLGYPAMKMDQHIETYKALRRLPRLFRDVKKLQTAIFKPTGKK